MRIYDLNQSMDKLINNENYQIELIGEDHCWTYYISRREWSNSLQRYAYEFICGGTTPDFLNAYDIIAETINRDNK